MLRDRNERVVVGDNSFAKNRTGAFLCAVAYTCAMLSPAEIARIKADIAALEKSRDSCADSGIRKVIEGRIEQQKKKLRESLTN
jgi:hypothetical protein